MLRAVAKLSNGSPKPFWLGSRREREVIALIVSGMLNKRVGGELDISQITVKAHRGQVMKKMHARSLLDLVTMDAKLELAPLAAGGLLSRLREE